MNGPLVVVVGLACAALIWGIAREGMGGGAEFIIRYRPRGRTTVRGRVPAGKVGGLSDFFAHDLKPTGTITIKGYRGAGGMRRMQVDGPLSSFERQRVRNFLVEHLR